jgi:hypothetical protein
VRQLCEASERRAVACQELGIALHPIQVCLRHVEHGRHRGVFAGRQPERAQRADLVLPQPEAANPTTNVTATATSTVRPAERG